MTRVVLVGATGSIGRSTLEVIRSLEPALRLHGVFSRRNGTGVGAIAREHGAAWAGVAEPQALAELRAAAPEARTGAGPEFLEEAVADPATDIVVSAASGAAGLPASLAAVRHGKRLALANKESLVIAGSLLLREAARTGAEIVPVDSEHSAIFQALRAGSRAEVRNVLLTASGGPFRTWSASRLKHATPEMALDHPTWNMGKKISIDSATLMNKALELIEAHWLFEELQPDQLRMLVHPQSIVHSMVEFVDGSIIAQMSKPDMRVPIQFALTWPRRLPADYVRFDLADFAQLTFEEPDRERFPAAAIGERAVRMGGTAGAIVNAANEVAVSRFLEGRIPFPAIAETVARVLEGARVVPDPGLDDIHAADRAAREEASLCRT